MEVSRRTFIKTTLIGGAGVSVFGFSLAPVYAQTGVIIHTIATDQ